MMRFYWMILASCFLPAPAGANADAEKCRSQSIEVIARCHVASAKLATACVSVSDEVEPRVECEDQIQGCMKCCQLLRSVQQCAKETNL